MNRLMFFLMCCIWLFITTTVQAQTGGEVEIVQAGSLEGVKRDGVEVRRLIGDVIFKRDSTYLYCDSALFYDETNSIDAYSRVRIVSTTARINRPLSADVATRSVSRALDPVLFSPQQARYPSRPDCQSTE